MKWLGALLSKLKNYVNRSTSEAYRWFRAGDTFWKWLVLTFAISFIFYFVPGQLSDRVRWVGSLFEFMGVCAVVMSINRARLSFGKPSVLRGILIWLGEFRFIVFRRPPISASVALSAGVSSVVGVGAVLIRAPKSTEERIAQLEKQITELETSLGNLDRKLDQQKRELLAEIERESAARQAGDSGVSKKLEEGVIGDSALEVAGIAYLILGLVMANLSTEVALVLKWVGFN
jgi:hypothetical protein